VGDRVRVRVLEVDLVRKRISLTARPSDLRGHASR
jgi:ribosomal protein S1